jgi:hypothetical protein
MERRVFPGTRLLSSFAVAALFAASPAAADGPVQLSLGYSYAKYLGEGDGRTAPVGAFLAVSGRHGLGLELDLGWQRDSEDLPDARVTLDTFTAVAGLRFGFAPDAAVRPFLHVLGGARHDRIEGLSDTIWGGFAGGGLDLEVGEGLALRLGADFQMFFDEGEDVKTLRLGVGLTF